MSTLIENANRIKLGVDAAIAAVNAKSPTLQAVNVDNLADAINSIPAQSAAKVKVSSVSEMFKDITANEDSLEHIEIMPNIERYGVFPLYQMMRNTKGIYEVPEGFFFDTVWGRKNSQGYYLFGKLDMYYAFSFNTDLQKINDALNVTNTTGAFLGSTNLQYIKELNVLDNNDLSSDAFSGCYSLKYCRMNLDSGTTNTQNVYIQDTQIGTGDYTVADTWDLDMGASYYMSRFFQLVNRGKLDPLADPFFSFIVIYQNSKPSNIYISTQQMQAYNAANSMTKQIIAQIIAEKNITLLTA